MGRTAHPIFYTHHPLASVLSLPTDQETAVAPRATDCQQPYAITPIFNMSSGVPTPRRQGSQIDSPGIRTPRRQGSQYESGGVRTPRRQGSMYEYNKPIKPLEPPNVLDHYIGIDVGTGSARACIIDEAGDIKALAAEDIKLWKPEVGYYEQSTTDIWHCICQCVRRVVAEAAIDPDSIKGIGFDATCSLAVFHTDTDEPVTVTGPDFWNDGEDRNVILWLDHRPEEETDKINATNHKLLKYVGGKMSIEMEIPKALWLKNNMPPELFEKCKFYDLTDALTHLATGNEVAASAAPSASKGTSLLVWRAARRAGRRTFSRRLVWATWPRTTLSAWAVCTA